MSKLTPEEALKIYDLITGEDSDERLLELYFGDPWPAMLHESYEELESPDYPPMTKSNMSPHEKTAPIEPSGTGIAAIMHESGSPYQYGMPYDSAPV